MESKGENIVVPPSSGQRVSKMADERIWALLDTLNVLLTTMATERSRTKKSKAKAECTAKSSDASPDQEKDLLSDRDRGGHHDCRFSMSAAADANILAKLLGMDALMADRDHIFAQALVAAQVDDRNINSKATEPPEAKYPAVDEAAPGAAETATPSTISTSNGSDNCDESSTRTIYRRIRRGEKPKPRGKRQQRRHRRRGTPRARKPKPVKARVASFVEAEEIEGTGYSLVLRLSGDQIMAHRRGHFEYWRRPKIEVRDNKTSEYRESYSGYCGRYPKLKSWLYYAWSASP